MLLHKSITWIGVLLLYALLCLSVVSIVLRYVANFPIPDIYDFSRFLHGIAVSFGLALVTTCRGHIRVDFLMTFFSERTKRILGTIADICIAITALLIFWRFSTSLPAIYARSEVTMMTSTPIVWFYAGICCGFALFALSAFMNVFSPETEYSGDSE